MSVGVRSLAALVVTGAALHFLGGNVADPDLWGHLRYGSLVWDGHGLPRVDTFSYTAAGRPFYDHEWLADVLFAGLFRASGSAGLVLFKLAVGAALIGLLLDATRSLDRGLRGGPALRAELHPLGTAFALVLVLAVVHPGATFRPQLFTMLLLAVELALLARADLRMAGPKGRGARIGWELWVLPSVLLLWANLHGGFLVGVGLLGLYVAALAWRAWRGRAAGEAEAVRPGEVALPAALAAAGVLAPLVNPYGLSLYVYLGRTLGLHDVISEWRPVGLVDGSFLRFKLLVVVAAASLYALSRHPRSERGGRRALVWWAMAAAAAALFAFRHQRHTVLFAEIAAPPVLLGAERARRAALDRWPDLLRRRVALGAVATAAAAIACVQVWGFARQVARDGLQIRFGRLDYPADAVAFIEASGLRGNMAFPFEWGAYAIWKLGSRARVFIDGRFEAVYPAPVVDDYFAFLNGGPGWERLLDAYPTEVVVVQRWRHIHPRLFARADLVYVYSDPAALVFVRPTATNARALARLERQADRHAFARPETFFP